MYRHKGTLSTMCKEQPYNVRNGTAQDAAWQSHGPLSTFEFFNSVKGTSTCTEYLGWVDMTEKEQVT